MTLVFDTGPLSSLSIYGLSVDISFIQEFKDSTRFIVSKYGPVQVESAGK